MPFPTLAESSPIQRQPNHDRGQEGFLIPHGTGINSLPAEPGVL